MSICIADTRELISQYKTRPAGKKANITPKQESAKKMGYGSIIGSTVAG